MADFLLNLSDSCPSIGYRLNIWQKCLDDVVHFSLQSQGTVMPLVLLFRKRLISDQVLMTTSLQRAPHPCVCIKNLWVALWGDWNNPHNLSWYSLASEEDPFLYLTKHWGWEKEFSNYFFPISVVWHSYPEINISFHCCHSIFFSTHAPKQ